MTDLWNVITNDDYLCQFADKISNSSDNVSQISSISDQKIAVSEQLSKLSEGINLLDKELQRQVLEKHEDLVSQATWAEKLQNVLSIMHIHVQSLLSSVERVRVKVVEPFARLESQTIVLSRLHATSDILRRAVRIQQLTKKLGVQESLRAAYTIADLGELCRDVDLSGLEILESEQKLIKKEAARVEQQALKILKQGLTSLNAPQVNMGIEIYMKLGILEKEMNKLLSSTIQQIEHDAQAALDMSSLVPSNARGGGAGRASGMIIPTNIQNFRGKLWSSWENVLLISVYPASSQMMLVQNVLNQKSGPRVSMGNEQSSEIASLFWSQTDDILSAQLETAAQVSSYIKQALEGEYPKLLRLHIDLHKKLKALDQANSSSKPVFQKMGKFGKQFETAYLSRSLILLLDSVRKMFPEDDGTTSHTPPTTERVDMLLKTISNELSVSLVDESLTKSVCQNVAKAVALFCQRGEQLIVTTGEATQVIETPKLGQELNVSIANIVHYLSEQVSSILGNLGLGKNVSGSILSTIDGCHSLMKQILDPLVSSIVDAVEAILLTIHDEDFDKVETSSSSSLYMKELKAFISRAVTSYLLPFHNQQLVSKKCSDIATRAIELFLRHTSLVRPLSEAGRKKLLGDFKSIEDAVSPLCTQLSELGAAYSALRSLKPLLAASPQEVASSPVLGQVIPFSLALTALFAKGPPQLPSPHKSVGWSVTKYSEWLDKHQNERDRLEFISGALQIYQQTVCSENQAEFHPVYPIMVQLLEKGAHSLSI